MRAAERRRLAIGTPSSEVGLADRAGHHSNQLSGGQQQRVAIARALITLTVDSARRRATGNLDTRTSVEVMGMFQRLNFERGSRFCSSRTSADIAEYATRVIACRDGHIVSDQPVRQRRVAEETGLPMKKPRR